VKISKTNFDRYLFREIIKKTLKSAFVAVEVLIIPFLCIIAIGSNLKNKKIDVGLGPEPLINNLYHARALRQYGYTAETFVTHVFYITSKFDKIFVARSRYFSPFISVIAFVHIIFNYRMLYIYFNGGPLSNMALLWRLEPYLLAMANIKVVVMPYGGDVQDLSKCQNLLFKNAVAKDYPLHKNRRRIINERIDMWTINANHVVAGCDWVDYLHHWDTLMLAHFSIDVEKMRGGNNCIVDYSRPLRILHAPNHRSIKGTQYFIDAIDELRREGIAVELILAERLPNEKIKELIRTVDVIADQLIIGWYAMFALEALAEGKPVLCYLRDDLLRFYIDVGLLRPGEMPIIRCDISTIKQKIRELAMNREQLSAIGQQGRLFVERHHSIEAVGAVFDSINKSMGIAPRSND
jgi:glycosyltransferase involved in cell wall biosynthesis